MKQFFKWIGKHIAGALVFSLFSILFIAGIVYALTYPSAPPAGEVAGGKFMTYFDKIFQGTCGANQAISGYDASKNPICVATGTGVNGGGWIDVPLTDTADFDINYEWMFIMHNSNDNLSYASYAGVVHPSLVRVGGISYVICSGSKNILRDGGACTGVHHVGNTITNIQKRKVNVTGIGTNGWVTIDSGGTQMSDHVRYTDGQDHSPEKICQTAGYTTFAGACRFIDTLGRKYNGSILANTQTYSPNWGIGCAYGSVNVWFSSTLSSSQILCIK